MGKFLIFILLFTPLFGQEEKPKEQLSLSMNFGEGEKLELSDGTTYDIDPNDRIFASYWITPIPLMLSESGDPNYPVKITNLNTGTSVNGKKIDTKQFIEEQYEKRKEEDEAVRQQPQQPQPQEQKTEQPPQQPTQKQDQKQNQQQGQNQQ